jgi:hypothetical protein
MIRAKRGFVMSKLMWLLGILLAAAGIALALMTTLSPGKMQAYGILPDTAAILFVGGVLSIGLGGVIDALRAGGRVAQRAETVGEQVKAAQTEIEVEPAADAIEEKAPFQIPTRFGRKAASATAATAAVVASSASTTAETTKSSVADTIAALDEAKADIKKALGGMDSVTATDDHPELSHKAPSESVAAVKASDVEEDASGADPELYVVEEKIIRGRPARILSDETVEAETDEGWMRFENLEHLNEYIDSTEEPDA